MKRLLAFACTATLALAAGIAAPSSFAEDEPVPATTAATTTQAALGDYLLRDIARYQRATWRWERLMQVPRTRSYGAARRADDAEQRELILLAWKQKAAKRRRQASNPPRLSAWLCIHRHERNPRQGWATSTGNGYWGGLQMDMSFQRTYGADLLRTKGTANRWSAIEQIWVAERAYRSGRGFYPWPNTARFCGLI